MLDALPKKNYRYDPNPVPKSDLVYSSYNEIKAAGGQHQSNRAGSYDPSLKLWLPQGVGGRIDAEQEKPNVQASQAKVGQEVQQVQIVMNSQAYKKNENDGYWDQGDDEDSDYEPHSPEQKPQRSSKRLKLLDVDEEEREAEKEEGENGEKGEKGEGEGGLQGSKGKEYEGIEGKREEDELDLKRQFIGEENIEQINQAAFQNMIEERKQNAMQMEYLRKFSDQEEFKKLESNILEEQDNDMEDIRKECLKIKMSDKFETSRSKFTESQLQNMIERHIQKEMYQSVKDDKKLKEEGRNELIGGKEMIRMTYENGSVKVEREVMESPVVALKLSGGEKIYTKRGSPRSSEMKREVEVAGSEMIQSAVQKSGLKPREDNHSNLEKSAQIQEVKKEDFGTPGAQVEAVTKAEVKVLGQSKAHIEELRLDDVNFELKPKADNQQGIEQLSPAIEAPAQAGKKRRGIKRGKDKMKIKGGCCGSKGCSIF